MTPFRFGRAFWAAGVAAMLSLVVFTAVASACTGRTWLNYVNTGANAVQYSGATNLNQAAARPGTNRWGCANMWYPNSGSYVFNNWYCGTISYQGATPFLGGSGVHAEPVAWNDWTQSQLLWGWECHS